MATDERITAVEEDRKEDLNEIEKTYGGMISDSQKYYNAQVDATREWADKQTELQNEKTDFAIEQIEQQKSQANKDYTKEQSGAYVDWQKQSNPYGANAEQMAANGLTNTGFSESSQVSMYNTYQNRVAAAREAYTRAVLNYDNAIKEARLQNNSVLAEIAYQALQKELELSLQGFQYKNQLIAEKLNQKNTAKQNYWSRYMSVLGQIHNENALAENKRQFNEQMDFQREQFEYQKAQAAKSSSGGGSSIKKSSSKSSSKKSSSGSSSGSGSVNKSTSNSSKSTKKSDATPDMDSVLALGYGPISASRLNELVESGKVVEYENNGKLYYKKVFAGK